MRRDEPVAHARAGAGEGVTQKSYRTAGERSGDTTGLHALYAAAPRIEIERGRGVSMHLLKKQKRKKS